MRPCTCITPLQLVDEVRSCIDNWSYEDTVFARRTFRDAIQKFEPDYRDDDLHEFSAALNHLFFNDKLDIDLEIRPDLYATKRYVGMTCTVEHSEYIKTELDPNPAAAPKIVQSYSHMGVAKVSIVVHEHIHGYIWQHSCLGITCYYDPCQTQCHTELGANSHGTAFRRIARLIQRKIREVTAFDVWL